MTNRLNVLADRLKRSLFVKHVSSLGAGTIVAHLITLAFSPVITRIYTAVEIGEFALFHSIVVVLSVGATLTYEYAIVLPENEKTARSLFLFGFFFTLFFSGLLFIVLILGYGTIASWMDISVLFLLLVPFGVFANSLLNLVINWFMRRTKYTDLSKAKITQSSTMGIIQVGLGMLSFTGIGLIAGHIGGRISFVIYQFKRHWKDLRYLFSAVNWSQIVKAAREYSKQPKFVLAATLLSIGALEAPVFLIGYLFDREMLGFYGLAFRVVSAPIALVGVSVGHVFFQQLADRKNRGQKVTSFLLKTWGGLFLFGLVPFTVLFFFAEPIFSFVFGADWKTAGTVAAILTPLLFVQLLSSPTGKSLMVVNKQHVMPFFSLLNMLARTLSLFAGAYYYDFFTGLWLMVAANAATLILYNIYLYSQLRKFDRSVTP